MLSLTKDICLGGGVCRPWSVCRRWAEWMMTRGGWQGREERMEASGAALSPLSIRRQFQGAHHLPFWPLVVIHYLSEP